VRRLDEVSVGGATLLDPVPRGQLADRIRPLMPLTRESRQKGGATQSVTIRLSRSSALALRRVSIQRSLDYQEPYSQQAIVEAALTAWLTHNGYSIVLEAMPGTDAQGLAGLANQVDWHAKRLAGATFLSTLIALGGNYAANIDPKQKQFSIAGETVAQDAARVGQRVIDRELDLSPTIIVRQGMPFNVLVTKDLELAPYRPVIARR